MGTEVEIGKIDGHQKRITAKVVGFPFYDPEKTRVKSWVKFHQKLST